MRRSLTPRRRAVPPPTLEALEGRQLLSTGLAPDPTGGRLLADPAAYAPDHILVRFRAGVAVAPGASPVAGTTVGQPLDGTGGLYQVRLAPGTTVAGALSAYRADRRVAEADPDYQLHASAVSNAAGFGEQWALQNAGQDGGTAGADIRATQAWGVTTGSQRTVVAVMDTGVDYDHPDLYQNIWLNQAEIPLSRRRNLIDVDGDGVITFRDLNDPRNWGPYKITDVNGDGRIDASDILAPMVKDRFGHDTGRGGWADGVSEDGDTAHVDDLVGWNFVNNTNRPFDDNGHGTHVSGIIGAMGAGGHVVGIDWHVQLMACKFLGADGNGGIGAFVQALHYAIAHGARISNNSWAGTDASPVLYNAIADARARGHILVAAAGNDGTNSDQTPAYPASFDLNNIISVAASDRNDHLAPFSNYSAGRVDLAAPGVDILSTTPHGTYSYYSGTSMAAPQVTGVVALVWGEHPTWSYQQVIAQVLNSTDVVPALRGKVRTGGRLDAARAVGAGGQVQAARVVTKVVASSASSPAPHSLGSIRLTFNTPINASTFSAIDVLLTGPRGEKIPLTAVRAVPNSGGRQFDLLFRTQTATGAYHLKVGPDVRSTAGVRMDVYQATFSLAARPAPRPVPAHVRPKPPAPHKAAPPPSTVTASAPRPVAVHDHSRAVSAIRVSQNLVIGRVTVRVDLRDPADGQIILHLQAPDGTDIVLARRRGGSGRNFQGTVFDDRAATAIGAGKAPFAGTFRPDGRLSALAGKIAHGTWRLWVENGSKAPGVLRGWSITFTRAGAAGRAASAEVSAAAVPAAGEAAPEAPVPAAPAAAVAAPPAAGSAAAAARTAGWADVARQLDAPAAPARPAAPTAPAPAAAADRVFASPEQVGLLVRMWRSVRGAARLASAKPAAAAKSDLAAPLA
jgi:subtilisin family serine protease/subtilisin-like proprotein convertase family protein